MLSGMSESGEQPSLEVLTRPMSRRGALALLGGLGLAVAGCSSGSDANNATATTKGASSSTTSTTGATTTTTGSTAAVTSCAVIPDETAGPYPGDGSNGPDVLNETGVVRKDIRSSFDGASGVAEGVPYTIQFTVVDTTNGCKPLSGAAVYVWHCDRDGQYSMYTASDANYLRGVQEVDANGVAGFTSIFPACYSGRWPHVHFEVYPSVDAATSGGTKLATSQIALPQDVCESVYATTGYEQSVQNLSRVALNTDMVFSDGVSLQTPSMTGNTSSGYVSSLVVGVSRAV
jgi:protocatechuate 3,4-dioxygenase beta subunit